MSPHGDHIVDMGSIQASALKAKPIRPPRKGGASRQRYTADHRKLAEALSRKRGYRVDVGKVALKIIETDCQVHYDNAVDRLEWEVWDKQSPINGVPAAQILGRPEYAKAEAIYLVKVDGELVFFQPHAPTSEGFVPLTDDDVEGYAISHTTKLAERIAFDNLLQTLESDPEIVALPSVDAGLVSAVAEQLSTGIPNRRRR